ncbi:hypothetical protein FRB96_006160 [Tulasnella sp. 330]|nr:hypothetical protein FRB96_006160 [Tulasnella sp. 330]KAG8872183.1 hypothetical protein FRB97_007896 [Tulasnella sp. 331]KAG8883783.1 hypothetical protein FRB98_002790 [Tulasnella sp. 332]
MPVSVAATSEGLASRFLRFCLETLGALLAIVLLSARDAIYTILSLVLPYRPVGKVVPEGQPGFQGLWPKYIPPGHDDSRSPCTALNALANHGILPRNGRMITYAMMIKGIKNAYNLSPTLAEQLTASAFLLDQRRGFINLHDLNATNVVQHDASITRPDVAFCPDQSYPHPRLVDRFLKCASGRIWGAKPNDERRRINTLDMAYYSGLRRHECMKTNGQYSLTRSFIHKFFGSGNDALLHGVFDGNVEDLRIWLAEERFPKNWEPRARWAYGYTILFAQKGSIEIEFNTHHHQLPRPGETLMRNQWDWVDPSPFAVAKAAT